MPHHLRILRGAPTPTELAALTAVLTALAAAPAGEPPAAPPPGRRRAHWDRGWRAHAPSGSWRSHLTGHRPHDHHR
ncbi:MULTISPECIES: acyl-CoA carboxylase epsilon subunit [Streptomyces]|uniref:Acyl-CoA carboxylase subunit epsilon n=1 Tax=Streptomyces lichenis TaxID=2306967 RepID=A0ABT0I8T6_9ACTN|nr:acyl-CoA carboxylase epsilon subunit [Streptomyces lichenis]MCK8677735.1 acyl-CoA carboxylase subunit epsilon [Streptomyces lichenis]